MFNQYVYRRPYARAAVAAYDFVGSVFNRKQRGKLPTPPKRIAFIILHQIGDMVMCLPAVHAAHSLFPDAEMHIIANSQVTALIAENRWDAQTHTFNPVWQQKVRQLGGLTDTNTQTAKTEFLQLLKKINPDVAIVFHPDLQTNQLLGQTTIPVTIGFANAGAGHRLTNPVWMPTTGHQVERNTTLVQKLAKLYKTKVHELKSHHLRIADEVTASLKEKLTNADLANKNIVVIHPCASDTARNWIPSHWDDVTEWLQDRGYTPVVIGGPKDPFPVSLKNMPSLAGKITLPETVALLKEAKLFIGVNSGPGHIAADVKTPVVSIFSSAHHPWRWAPWGPEECVTVLCKPAAGQEWGPTVREDEAREVGDPEQNMYSRGITPHLVITAAAKFLGETV